MMGKSKAQQRLIDNLQEEFNKVSLSLDNMICVFSLPKLGFLQNCNFA